jgi:serine/threonine protein phosphatase PrpC
MDQGERDFAIAERALEFVNGDMAFVRHVGEQLFVALFDGAGHGDGAHEIAQKSLIFLETRMDWALPKLMNGLHEHLRGSRGGVAIVGRLDRSQAAFRYVGLGNISIRKFGRCPHRHLTQEGVIGYQIRAPKEQCVELSFGDVLVLHTDGIRSQFDVEDYPGLMKDDARTIANHLVSEFGKNDDDATCVVIR